MLEQYQTRIITAMISNPDVKLSRYRIRMATAAARTNRMKVAAAPSSTASGVISAEDESRLEGPQTSGKTGQGRQPPPEGLVPLPKLEVMLPAPSS
jgi:hypothetical protein